MKQFVDFLPVIVFYGVYQAYGRFVSMDDRLFAATAAIMIAMTIQISVQWFLQRTVSKMLLTSGILVLVFGGITLALRDPLFIQWKPTIINWLFALVFLGSQYIGAQPLIKRIMGHAIELPDVMWRQLNWMWVGNFSILGAVNIYVVYNYSEATWVNFKLYGMLGITLVMALIQGVWIARKTEGQTQGEP